MTTENINLFMDAKQAITSEIHVMQYDDDSREIVCNLLHNGMPYELGYPPVISANFKKPDGKIVVYDTDNDVGVIEPIGGTGISSFKVKIKKEVTGIPGTVICNFSFDEPVGSEKRSFISTTTLKIIVHKIAVSENDVVSTDTYRKVEEMSELVSELYVDIQPIAVSEQSRIEAETARSTSEQNRVSAENTRIASEQNREIDRYLLLDEIRNTTQYYTFEDGDQNKNLLITFHISKATGSLLREDDFEYFGENLIVEKRTLYTPQGNQILTIKYHLDTLSTEVI